MDMEELINQHVECYWQNYIREPGDYKYRGLDSETRYKEYLLDKGT